MTNNDTAQTSLHKLVLDARDTERAALARLASMKPHYFINVFSTFVPVKHGETTILADLKNMQQVSTSLGRYPRQGEKYSAQYQGTAFSPNGDKFHVAFTLDHDAGITATRHHVINGLPARDATVTDLHQRAIPLDTTIDRLEKSELTRDIRYMPSVKSGDNVVPADRFKKEENCFAFYSPSSDGSLRLIADFPTSGEAYDFMDTIKAFFKEFPSELLDVTCTSGEELTKLSHQIQETEKTMSAQSQTSTSQKTKPHFNTRIANQLSQQLRDGTAPMQRQGVQDIPYNPATGRTFHGINAMSLMMQGRKDDRWFTFDDASACGYKVKSGEKGTPVQKWPKKKPGETMNKAITTYVFNAEQLDRVPPQTLKPERPDPVDRVNDLLKNSGMTVIHDQAERSFYAPRKDEIHLPKPENCKSKEDYCEKAIYEYMKATGHPDRQNRETWNAVSASDRAKEELICTTATMMMCAEMGIPHDSTRNPELALDWGKSMEHHPFEFAKAMHQADTAVFTTLRQEQAMNAEIGFQSNEPWRPVPEASPAVAVHTFLRQNEAVELSKTEPEKLHSFEYNNREIYAHPETGIILDKRGDIEDDGRVDMKVKTDAYDREGNTYSVVMNYTVAMNENGMAALTAPAKAEDIQLTTRQMALPIDWEGTLEVRGCADDMDGNIRSDITDPAQIQFYGVYANTKDGEQQHLAEFNTEAQAKRYAQLIDNEYSRQAKHETVQEQPRTPERQAAPEPEAPQRDSEEQQQQSEKGYTLDGDQKKELVDKAKEHVEKRDDDLKETYDKTAKRLKSQVKRFDTPKEQTPYMKANDVQLRPGVYQNGNSTCIPLYNNNGEMRSMAYVQEDSTTRYARNSDRQGCYHIIGGHEAMKKAPVGIITNEYATAAKISESVGLPVIATVGNDNLVDAAKEFRAANPDKPIIIAADRNAEIEARFAAAAISAAIVLPAVADKAMEKEVNSFNDLARVHGELGKDAIKGQIQPTIDKETSHKVEKTQEHEAKAEKQRGQELARI